MKRLDIAVAGCGPCGLASALLLARAGHRVTLFERFQTPQPIGSGLLIQPTGAAVLDRLGLGDGLRGQGTVVSRLLGITAGGRTVLDVAYAALAGARTAIGVHRASLFALLFDAVGREAIALETGYDIVGSEATGAGRRLLFTGGRASARFDLVVDALGSSTPLAPRRGRELDFGALWATLDRLLASSFDPRTLEQRYRAARQMAGVLPIGRGIGGSGDQIAFFWSIRGDALARWRAEGLAAWKHDVLRLWPATEALLEQIVSREQLTFARYAHRTVRHPAEPQLIRLGDAWHSASPQLGQGANMALLDAYALASAIESARDVPEALMRAVASRRGHVRLYQMLTALLTPVYQSDSVAVPWVRDRILGPLSHIGWVNRLQAALVAGLVGAPLARLGLG